MKAPDTIFYDPESSVMRHSRELFAHRWEQARRSDVGCRQQQPLAAWKESRFRSAPQYLDHLLDCRTLYGTPIPVHHFSANCYDVYFVGGRLVLVNSAREAHVFTDVAVFTSTELDDVRAYDYATLRSCFYPLTTAPVVDGIPIIRRAAIPELRRRLFDGLEGYYTECRGGLDRAREMRNRKGDVHQSWFPEDDVVEDGSSDGESSEDESSDDDSLDVDERVLPEDIEFSVRFPPLLEEGPFSDGDSTD